MKIKLIVEGKADELFVVSRVPGLQEKVNTGTKLYTVRKVVHLLGIDPNGSLPVADVTAA